MSSALNKIRTTIQLIFSLGKTLGNVMRFDFNQKTIRLFVKVNAFIFVFFKAIVLLVGALGSVYYIS